MMPAIAPQDQIDGGEGAASIAASTVDASIDEASESESEEVNGLREAAMDQADVDMVDGMDMDVDDKAMQPSAVVGAEDGKEQQLGESETKRKREEDEETRLIVKRVLQRAQVARTIRSFRSRLALAAFKAQRGWEDVKLDDIEPHLEKEALDRRIASQNAQMQAQQQQQQQQQQKQQQQQQLQQHQQLHYQQQQHKSRAPQLIPSPSSSLPIRQEHHYSAPLMATSYSLPPQQSSQMHHSMGPPMTNGKRSRNGSARRSSGGSEMRSSHDYISPVMSMPLMPLVMPIGGDGYMYRSPENMRNGGGSNNGSGNTSGSGSMMMNPATGSNDFSSSAYRGVRSPMVTQPLQQHQQHSQQHQQQQQVYLSRNHYPSESTLYAPQQQHNSHDSSAPVLKRRLTLGTESKSPRRRSVGPMMSNSAPRPSSSSAAPKLVDPSPSTLRTRRPYFDADPSAILSSNHRYNGDYLGAGDPSRPRSSSATKNNAADTLTGLFEASRGSVSPSFTPALLPNATINDSASSTSTSSALMSSPTLSHPSASSTALPLSQSALASTIFGPSTPPRSISSAARARINSSSSRMETMENGRGVSGSGAGAGGDGGAELMLFLAASPSPIAARSTSLQFGEGGSGMTGRRLFSGGSSGLGGDLGSEAGRDSSELERSRSEGGAASFPSPAGWEVETPRFLSSGGSPSLLASSLSIPSPSPSSSTPQQQQLLGTNSINSNPFAIHHSAASASTSSSSLSAGNRLSNSDQFHHDIGMTQHLEVDFLMIRRPPRRERSVSYNANWDAFLNHSPEMASATIGTT